MEWPTDWIQRTFEGIIAHPQKIGPFSALLLLGPRQVGKSSLLRRLASSEALHINLDELETRARAISDPVLFARDFRLPLLIDEIQYAPQLLSAVKVLADNARRVPLIWLTGSQSFEVMRGVQESLAGRVAILNLYGLSLVEKKVDLLAPPSDLFREFFIGTFPALRSASTDPWTRFMSSYVQTYVERDVAELLGIQKRREFEIFLKLCALRTGQLINYDEIARDSGISPATAKDWISVLEDSFLIRIVEPYHTNRSKRIIKTPKLYFIDSGICAYLAGWRDSEQLRLSPWSGPFFETVIFGELLRHFAHRGKECQIYFWRTKDGAEVDFLVRTDSGVTPVEVKLGIPKKSDLIPLENLPIDNLTEGALVSLAATSSLGHSAHPGWRYQSLAMDWLK